MRSKFENGEFISRLTVIPEFGAKLAISWENDRLNQDFGSLMVFLSLTLNAEPVNGYQI
jgi:hypothetical protein